MRHYTSAGFPLHLDAGSCSTTTAASTAGSSTSRQTFGPAASDAASLRLVNCRAAHTDTKQQTNALEDDVQADNELGDDDLDTEAADEGPDDIDDDEMQSMLQDDEASAGAMTDTANTEWGTKALLIVQQVLQQSSMQELALFSLMASPKHKQLKIRLDKPSDEYGSPSLDEVAVFSTQFADEYHKAIGEAAEDIAVEVSSPGAERQVRVPQDLIRFQHLPMLVTFQLKDSTKTDTKVLELVSYNEADATAEWKLADVKQNRSGKGVSKLSKKQAGQRYEMSLAALLKVNLHLEV